MKLYIKNLAKLSEVELSLDGITVVVGNNNTGKSTLGKTLWAMFQSFSNLPDRAQNARRWKCQKILSEFAFRFYKSVQSLRQITAYSHLDELLNGKVSMEEWKQLLLEKIDASRETLQWDEWERRFQEVLSLSEMELQCQIVYETFDVVFDEQFLSLREDVDLPVVKMTVRGKELSAHFTKDGLPEITNGIALQHHAFLFDSPNRLEQLARGASWTARTSFLDERHRSTPSGNLVSQIWQSFQRSDSDVVDKLLVRKKLDRVNAILSQTMKGTLQKSQKGEIQFISKEFPSQPIHLCNLSQGLKALALLQAAFLRNAIGEEDVLILDEPEIHLHPEWQLIYAEVIVLLQKEFHLTVLLTSHSPDFVQAVRLYSQKHGLNGNLNGYLSEEQENGGVSMRELPKDNWDALFERFTTSYDKLHELRMELEMRDK